MHQPQDDNAYISPYSCDLLLVTVKSLSKMFAPTLCNIIESSQITEVEMADAMLANAQLLAAAVASWTITKAGMAIQPNMAIQAISNRMNGKQSSVSYQLFWCLNS